MKSHTVWLLGLTLTVAPLAAQQKGALKTQKEKISYSIGLDIGRNFKQQAIEVDADVLLRGIKDGLSDSKPLLTDEEAREVLMALQRELVEKMNEKTRMLAEKNRKDGDAFLAANKKNKGVKALASGLQYLVLKEGAGKRPKATDTVVTHYRGTLIDGKEFDSSYSRGEPAVFPVNGVIKGWTEVLQLMKVGSKWQVVIPPHLAYGESGAGPDIGPNATLVFEIELVAIK